MRLAGRCEYTTKKQNISKTLYHTSEKLVSCPLLQQKIKYQVYFIHPEEY